MTTMKKLSSSILILVLGFYMVLYTNDSGANAFIGINWGRMSSQRLIPSMVVDLLLQNGIKQVRIFQQLPNVLEAFSGSGIGITFGLANTVLKNYVNESVARTWIQDKIIKFSNIDIRYVTIGTEPFSSSFKNKTYDNAVDVLKLIQNQLNSIGYGRIKATIPHYTDVLTLNKTSRPSDADFRPDIKEKMIDSIRFLKENNAPFMAGFFPIDYVSRNDLNPEFAFIDNKSDFVVKDINGHIYTNVFEFLYDSYHWALAKAGGGDLQVIVSVVGWPTDGSKDATISNAQRFYKSFLPFVTSNKGSPMRPGAPIDIYLHSLSDENRNVIELGGFQRHWGIYKFNGEPKYKIDFSGQGRDIFPSTAKGVIHMPRRWCVYNGDTRDMNKVNLEYHSACIYSDCSSMLDGGSCSKLEHKDKVSYAFNRYFQMEAQSSVASNKVCNMQGLGKLVLDDPSVGTCVFPVEILSAEIAVSGAKFGGSNNGERVCGSIILSGLLMLLMIVLFH